MNLKSASDGTEYLELTERQTKTRTGENPADIRKVTPKIYSSENDDRNPIKLYKLYASKRPTGFSRVDDPFYVAPRTTDLTDQWYIKLPVGERKMSTMLKTMAVQGGLDKEKRLTNHSARKHLVQKLRDCGVAPTDIMQVSGHKNIQSILTYSAMSENQQKECSNILSNSHTNINKPKENQIEKPSTITSSSAYVEEDVSFAPGSENIPPVVNDPVNIENAMPFPTHPMSLTQRQRGSDDEQGANRSVVPPVSLQSVSMTSDTNQQIVKSMFSGASVNIGTFNLYMK